MFLYPEGPSRLLPYAGYGMGHFVIAASVGKGSIGLGCYSSYKIAVRVSTKLYT